MCKEHLFELSAMFGFACASADRNGRAQGEMGGTDYKTDEYQA
jgi:hypothetical protein